VPKSHICPSCLTELAKVRAIPDPHYGLAVVVCPSCLLATVRTRHPDIEFWRGFRRFHQSLRVVIAKVLLMALLAGVMTLLISAAGDIYTPFGRFDLMYPFRDGDPWTTIFGMGVPTTVAIGTDLFQIVVTGSWGTFIYALSHNVDPLMAIIMLGAASVGSQLGTAATAFVEPARIRILYGVTIMGGAISVALDQVSTYSDSLDFLSTLASVVLLSVAGTMCLIIAGMMIKAKRERKELATADD